MEQSAANSFFSFEAFSNRLKSDPGLLQRESDISDLTLLSSDLRKRYTEFYRIEVSGGSEGDTRYWIRHLKNKPEVAIHLALKKQFSVMEKLYYFFEQRVIPDRHFSCSQPIVLLPDCNLLITKECSGILMNDYLVRKFPVVAKKEIVGHCEQVGYWLALFHLCFKEISSETVLAEHITDFEAKYDRPPTEGCDFMSSCHHDYSPRNIFVSPQSVEVIDFVAVEPGLPDEDIHFFCRYLRKARFNMLYSMGMKEQMIDAFLEGYHAGGATV